MNLDPVRERFPDRRILYFESIDTTMREAARLAASGCPSGTVVVAGEQTAGQGRHGHSWHSEQDAGLYLSIVLRPGGDRPAVPALTMALGLATAEAIARSTDLACDIRWPNDLMIHDRKVAGILVNLADHTAIAGIGINVNHRAFPPELERQATSLRLATGKEHSREQLLTNLLQSVDGFSRMLRDGGTAAIFAQFSRRSTYASGKRVTVDLGGRVISGVTDGLDPNGFLRVRMEDGRVETVVAGGVRAAGD